MRRVLPAAEAALLLLVVTVLRRRTDLRRWTRVIGRAGPVVTVPEGPLSGSSLLVAQAVARADRRLPFATSCLDRAIAAKVMLRRRGAPSRLVIGGAPGREPALHAWLVDGAGAVLVGGEERAGYTPFSQFD